MRFQFDELEPFRFRTGSHSSGVGDDFGAFQIPGPCGMSLRIIASSGDPENEVYWEHVSVSLFNRTPNWTEMCFVKALFWDDEEPVMQLHPPKSTWINQHPYCLHLWRPIGAEIPLPPSILVGMGHR